MAVMKCDHDVRKAKECRETLGLIAFRANETVDFDEAGNCTATYRELLSALLDIRAAALHGGKYANQALDKAIT